jgi:hypothetical protein
MSADQARLGGNLFPRKHPGIIFAEIRRTYFTGCFTILAWRKSPMALLTNSTVPANLRTTDFTKRENRLGVHAGQCSSGWWQMPAALGGVSAYRRIGFWN